MTDYLLDQPNAFRDMIRKTHTVELRKRQLKHAEKELAASQDFLLKSVATVMRSHDENFDLKRPRK